MRKWMLEPKVNMALRCFGYGLAGFCLSAASLGGHSQTFAFGLVLSCSGWPALLAAVGGGVGYAVFWTGGQGAVWMGMSLLIALVLGDRRISRNAPLLLPATAGLLAAASGLAFQMTGLDTSPVVIYILRVGMAFGSTYLFFQLFQGRNPFLEWLAGGIGVLALAQIAPTVWLNFGIAAAAALAVSGTFPGAALAGLGLDLAQITPVPMTAVMSAGYLVRFFPAKSKWAARLFPAVIYVLTMYLCGKWDPYPLVPMAVGGILGGFLPAASKNTLRKGETGGAQVRLEMASQVLHQTQNILMETEPAPIDEEALVQKAAERACGGCPCRKNCKDSRRIKMLPGMLLHKPLLSQEELPVICRKNGRFLAELHRSQEQLRAIHADRQRQQEYRAAVVQQYHFLGDFLQDLSDRLASRGATPEIRFSADVRTYGNRQREDNGDSTTQFAGVMGKYYVLLCDGMGTGMGAVQEGRRATGMLRRLLQAGYPAAHALRSLNSLCALRERAGAVTVDLLELELGSGKAVLYKWGAAPSYVIGDKDVQRIGTAGPPPGLLATETREESYRLSLRGGQMLVMVSDGVGEEEALRCCRTGTSLSPGELATKLLTGQQEVGQDDATVITVRLKPASTQGS